MYKVAGVDPEHSLSKFFICCMGAKTEEGLRERGPGNRERGYLFT